MKHLMNLKPNPFNAIKGGFKRVEMRLYNHKQKQIKPGDDIQFTNEENGEKLLVKVIDIKAFKNFEALYENYDKTLLGYMPNEIANPSDMLQYYSAQDIEQTGVCAIEIKLI